MEKYLIDRLLSVPKSQLKISEQSIPVISFGDFTKSKVATLGINPSKNEFIVKKNEQNRFETFVSVGCEDLSLITENQISVVLSSFKGYFHNNPYRKWFDVLEKYILNKIGFSYQDDSACHLDLVQWATDPVWQKLDRDVQIELLKDDVPFLLSQLTFSNITLLLVNGRTAVETLFRNVDLLNLLNHRYEFLIVDGKKCTVTYAELHIKKKAIKIIGWSSNLQSTVGLTNAMREAIGDWVLKTFEAPTLSQGF